MVRRYAISLFNSYVAAALHIPSQLKSELGKPIGVTTAHEIRRVVIPIWLSVPAACNYERAGSFTTGSDPIIYITFNTHPYPVC